MMVAFSLVVYYCGVSVDAFLVIDSRTQLQIKECPIRSRRPRRVVGKLECLFFIATSIESYYYYYQYPTLDGHGRFRGRHQSSSTGSNTAVAVGFCPKSGTPAIALLVWMPHNKEREMVAAALRDVRCTRCIPQPGSDAKTPTRARRFFGGKMAIGIYVQSDSDPQPEFECSRCIRIRGGKKRSTEFDTDARGKRVRIMEPAS